jgi:hypothetical protein
MSIEAMKQALEALEEIYRTGDTQAFDLCYAPNVIPALRQAIAEAEKQEPVGYVSEPGSCTKVGTKSGVLPTEWVGLDPETMRNTTLEFNRGALWAERYLKERNA